MTLTGEAVSGQAGEFVVVAIQNIATWTDNGDGTQSGVVLCATMCENGEGFASHWSAEGEVPFAWSPLPSFDLFSDLRISVTGTE